MTITELMDFLKKDVLKNDAFADKFGKNAAAQINTLSKCILFSTYYREGRKKMNKKDSLISAYRGSIHTIMTSGSILVIVTGVLSQYFPDPSTAQICQNISIGALCASLLILFILPGILVTVDRFIVKKEGYAEVNILSKKLVIKQSKEKGKKVS